MATNSNMYWGYKNKSGKYVIQRFSTYSVIMDAYESGECVTATPPFMAKTPVAANKHARDIIRRKLSIQSK